MEIKRGSMDNKEIEELRALAFASIPSVARKSYPPIVKRKRVSSVENEEGEIVSDEDVDSGGASHCHLDGNNETSCKEALSTTTWQKEEHLVNAKCNAGSSREALDSAILSDLASDTVSAQVHVPGIRQIGSSASKKEAMVYRKDTKLIQQRHATMNTPRPSRIVPGSLPSRIPSIPLTAMGVRKEADVFLASLNIPLTASPSNLEGDRSNSLVIKFSDDDSDSDKDQQQGQSGIKNSQNRKSIPNGIPHQGTAGGDLKSEIDRVKKQIAAIERTKGKVISSPGSTLSKSAPKSGQLSTSVSSPMMPVELESLRQQIAAKENELQLRKRGSADVLVSSQVSNSRLGSQVDNDNKNRLQLGQAVVDLSTSGKTQVNTASNELQSQKRGSADIFGSPQTSNSRLGSPVDTENKNIIELGRAAVQLSTSDKSQVNAALDDVDLSSSKVDKGHTLESHPQRTIFSKPALMTNIANASTSSRTIEPHAADNGKALESVQPVGSKDTGLLTRKQDQENIAMNPNNTKVITTPKRKRDEGKRSRIPYPVGGEESAKKKQKQYKCPIQMPTKSQDRPSGKIYNETNSCDRLTMSMPVDAVPFELPDGQELLNLSPKSSKYMENSTLALPTIIAPQKKISTQEGVTSLMHSTGEAVAVKTSRDLTNTTCPENVVSCLTPYQINSIQGHLSEQTKTAPKNILEKINVSQQLDTSHCKQANTMIHISATIANEAQKDSLSFPDGKKELQMVFIRPTSTSSSVPVWALDGGVQNAVHVFQGVSEQGLEYGHDTLQQWQEEEDLIDKELEAAQQNRRRCEVRERLARRQYREAQEALRSANVDCEMLYQKREMLASRIKSAELQLYSNKSRLHAQHDAGIFHAFNSPVYSNSGKTSLRLETPVWCREGGTAQSNHEMDPKTGHISGKESDLAQGLEMHHTDNCVVSEATNQHLSTDDHNEKNKDFDVRVTNQAKNISNADVNDVEIQGKSGRITVESSFLLPVLKEQPQPDISTGFLINESEPEFYNLSRACVDGVKCVTDDSVIVSTLSEKHGYGIDKDYNYGFSSASFATDLDKETSATFQNSVDRDHVILKDEEAAAKRMNLTTASQCGSLVIETYSPCNVHTDVEYRTHRMSGEMDVNDASAPMAVSNDFCPMNSSACTDGEDSCLPDAVPPEKNAGSSILDQHVDKEATQEPLSGFVSVHPSLVKTDEQIVDADLNKHSLHRRKHVSAIQSIQHQKSSENCSFCINQSPSVAFDAQAYKALEGLGIHRSRNEELPDSQSEKVSGTKTAVKPGLESFVPSSKLDVLFSHIAKPISLESTMAAWKQQSSLHSMHEIIKIESPKYESPCSAFSSHNGSSDHVDSLPSYSKRMCILDPYKTLCKYEHRGKCNNDECIWQHKRDYTLRSSPTSNNQDKSIEGAELKDMADTIEKGSIKVTSTSTWKWNTHLTKVPIYRIGSHIMKANYFPSSMSYLVCKQQLGFEQHFPALHRCTSSDMLLLYDSSLKLQNLADSSLESRPLLFSDRPRAEVEGHLSSNLEDVESLMESALELINFDLKVENPEVQKSVLYMLSRGLEVKPFFVALWIVYLHLFTRWEKGIPKDDLFYHAVHHNRGSYELWMMFINSRGNLPQRLEAYERAIIALGSQDELQGQPVKKNSSFLLDLVLQQLNCMCVSGLSEAAVKWIDELMLSVSEDVQGCQISSASIILTHLVYSDLCILWICCAYVLLQMQIPERIIENLGCKQQLCFQNIWCNVKATKPCSSKAMKLMEIAASEGKGCLGLESIGLHLDTESRLPKEFFAANYVQCAAVCKGLEFSLTLAEKFFNLYASSVELTILRARLEAHFKGNMAALTIFEKALSCWPLHQSGKLRLWNQYFGFSVDAKGPGYAKVLLARCAAEIHESESFRSVCKDVCGSTTCDISVEMWNTLRNEFQHLKEAPTHGYIQKAFQFLPSIVKRQLRNEFKVSGQVFSYQDAVFGYLNLAFSEALDGEFDSARVALHNSLNIAADTDIMQQCLKELAASICGGLRSSTVTIQWNNYDKMLSLFDRCLMETQLLASTHPLSKSFCESIKKRRVRLFVDNLLGPWPNNCTFFNTVLETMYGPTLIPDGLLPLKDLVDFTEKILQVLPNNVRLALSACRAVQSKVNNCNPLTKSATLFWSASLLVDSLCQSLPEAPESCWVEAGNFLELLELEGLLEAFYQFALLAYPFSTSLWSRLLAIGRKTGNINSITQLAVEKGVKVDVRSERDFC